MMDGRCHPSLYKNKVQKFDFRCDEMKAVFIPNYCEQTGYSSLFNRIISACTYNGFTAQGFPTSPVLANIVMRGLDISVSDHCEKHGIVYTRYADDLAFSSKTLSKEELRALTQKFVYRQLWAYNFEPNRDKTLYKSKAGRLKICGVVVNEKKNIQRSVVHRFRACVHHAITMFPEKTTKTRLRKLKGWASFLMSINHDKGKYYMDKLLAFEKAKFS
jgi:retron-type reverse transcriptase